jgi:O-antigen/teichoic acid export membrane protein
VTLPIALVLLLLGKWLLGLYGAPFRAAYPVLVLLVIAASTVALVGSLGGFLLTMTEYQKEAAWIIGGSALLNLALAVVLTPLFGLVGTASATLIATVARSAVLVVFLRRTMGVNVLHVG